MLEKIIEASVNNRLLVIVFALLIALAGAYAMLRTPVDAIPDLSDVQVIIFTEYPGQAPQVVEDQVTYPLTTAMLGVPFAKAVRGYSFFGYSFVYIIFEDGTDMYWARSRVLEYLNYVASRLPGGVTPTLGPDATGVGWAFEYVIDGGDQYDLQQLRSIQDWFLRYELMSVSGVAEVASIGGYVKQYQVEVDPNKLLAYNIPLSKVRMALQRSNNDVGGRLVEMGETEFMVRGLGYIQSIEDIENTPVGVDENGTPILIRNIAHVHLGPELRRGLADLDGEGETVGGIVIMRYGENALKTIDAVKAKLEELKAGLPEGVTIQAVYDRSSLIERAIENLKGTLLEESIIVALVTILFLLHFRSAFVAIFTLPMGILIAFLIMYFQGLNANIMSLSGIAIAIGAMVDAAIVMIENAHKHMERDAGKKDHWRIIIDASKEVGPALFYSLLIITLSFLPVFTLPGAGRPALQTAGFHENLRHGGLSAPGHHGCTGADGLLHTRQNPAGEKESPQPLSDVRISPGDSRRTPVQMDNYCGCAGSPGGYGLSPRQARLRIYAAFERGGSALHAHHRSGHQHYQSQGTPAANEQNHQELPRSGSCFRQGGPCRDGD